MKVLVVGGAGYIGSHVVLELLAKGHQVWIYDNLSKGVMENVIDKSRFIRGDILDENTLDQTFQKGGFNAVVHLAALKAVGESMTEIAKYAKNNINGTINLLNTMAKFNVKAIVFSSSAATYGTPNYTPVDENHPTNPESFYGFTKLEIEKLLYWYDKIKGIKSICLRYFNAVGYDPDGKVPGLEKDPQNLLPIIMEVIFKKRNELKIFGGDYDTPDGTCIRDYIHVSDLASAHLKSVEYLINNQGHSQIMNLGTESGLSVLEIVKNTESVLNMKLPHSIVDRRAGDPGILIASSKKARDLLNWSPKISDAKTIIESTFRVYNKYFDL